MRNILVLLALTVMLSLGTVALEIENASSNVNSRTFDSIDNEIDILIKKGDNPNAIRLMNEKGKLLFNKGLYTNEIILMSKAIELSNRGMDTLKHPEVKELYMESLNSIGMAYSYVAKYEDAINCYIAMDKYNIGKNALYKTKFYNGMGVVFSMSGKYDLAKKYYLQALLMVEMIKDDRAKQSNSLSINANLGGVFLIQEIYDSAHLYIIEAQKLAVLTKNKSKSIACLQLLGALNNGTGNLDLAINYYNKACDMALECKDYYMVPFIKLNICIAYMENKDYNKALSSAMECLEISKKFRMKKLEMSAMQRMSKIYKHLGHAEKALYYIEESNKIRDSLFSQDNEERFIRQKTDFDMYKMSVEKDILNKDLEIERGRRFTINLIVFFIITILFGGSIWVTYKLYWQYKLNKKLNRQHEDDINLLLNEKKVFDVEIDKKNRDISKYTILVVKINEAKSTILSKLKIVKSNMSSSNKGYETIKEIESIVQSFQVGESSELKDLNHYFDQVSADFYYKLECRYPDLTLSERKMCALISLGLSQKDMLSLTGKTSSAISNIKLRIKKKVDVDANMDLREFLSKI